MNLFLIWLDYEELSCNSLEINSIDLRSTAYLHASQRSFLYIFITEISFLFEFPVFFLHDIYITVSNEPNFL